MENRNGAQVRERAEEYYRNGDFYCSEAVVKAVLEGAGAELSRETIAMASGFPVGIGGAECTCGALSGGVMALGYFFGRAKAKEPQVKRAMALSKELHDSFKQRNKATCCRVLTKGMTKGSPQHMSQCVRLTGEVAEDVARIIERESGADDCAQNR